MFMKALRFVYDDHNSSYCKPLMANNEPTIHQQNINVQVQGYVSSSQYKQ